MAKLFLVSTRMTLDGKVANASYGNRILYEARDAHTPAERDALNRGLANVLKSILVSGVGIYTVTNSPVSAPGTSTKDRTQHKTTYIEEPGARAMPAGKSIGPLNICADFFKEASIGNGGNILVRGVVSEAEIDTDAAGNLEKPTGALLETFDAAATNLKALFEQQGGRGLVLPGRTQNDDGSFVTLEAYTASARNVDDLFFEGLVFRQTTKQTTSLDQEERDLLRRRIRQLVKAYNDFKKFAPGGIIPPEDEASLYDMGEEIYAKSSPTDRNRVKTPTYVKKYIRKAVI
jgi:hypothetical protein